MTARQVYEGVLTELNKVLAPPLLLEDFNYFFNKAINQYVNKRYNIYDVNEQTTDDIRVLKSTAVLVPILTPDNNGFNIDKKITGRNGFLGATYTFNLPADYLHLLNCTVEYYVRKTHGCDNAGDYVDFGATRLTSDAWPIMILNLYMRPSYRRPYYIITNRNLWLDEISTKNTNPTNPIKHDDNTNTSIQITGTDYSDDETVTENTAESNTGRIGEQNSMKVNKPQLPRYILFDGNYKGSDSVIEKLAGHRYGNSSNVLLEIRYGKDNTVYELVSILVDYIKAPLYIRLTRELLDLVEDTSQIMEFPDYVCQEIINELTHIIMENSSDPRLLSHPVVTLSIANPAQELTPQQNKK